MSADTCANCGRLPTINGRYETVFMTSDGFRHAVCDERWDQECQECEDGMVYGPEWEDWDRRALMPCDVCGGSGVLLASRTENVESPFVHTDAVGSRLRHEFVQTPASGSMCSACGKPKNDHPRRENVETSNETF